MFLVPINRSATGWVRNFDRLFDESFDRFFSGAATSAEARTPALDVAESGQAYTITLDLPGVAKDDIQVTIDGHQVTIAAEVKHDVERKEGERTLHSERYVGSLFRSFTLPAEVDESASSAKYENGVLELRLARKAPQAGRKLSIQ